MSAEDLERYETEMELDLYREYRDVVGIFKYVVETDRRFYLCNQVDVKARSETGEVFFELRPEGFVHGDEPVRITGAEELRRFLGLG